MTTRKTVSLFLYDPSREIVILSQRSKNVKRTGLLQATTHGALENNETDEQALARELKEETMVDFKDIKNLKLIRKVEVGQVIPEECSYYLADIDPLTIEQMQKTEEVERFVEIGIEDVQEIIPFYKAEKENLELTKNKVMFDDELGVLKEVFKIKLGL